MGPQGKMISELNDPMEKSEMNKQIITIKHGDCVEKMKTLSDESVGGFVTDPPYLIGFMSREWDKATTNTKTFTPSTDTDETEDDAISVEDIHAMEVFHIAWLKEAFRILKPGGIAKVFAATRTMHRLSAAMESVGFILDPKDSITAWCYGSGFPKSLNLEKSIDAYLGKTDEREVIGMTRGVGGENMNDIVAGRDVIRTTDDPGGKGVGAYGTGAKQVGIDIPVTAPASEEAKQFSGWGTALKPAWEPFVVGRKPQTNT